MKSRRKILYGTLGTFMAFAGVVACSDEEEPRTSFDVEAGAPSMPEAAAPIDASAPDAPDARGSFDPSDQPVTCAGDPCVTQLVAGSHHFCALVKGGTVRCWGDDTLGQLGLGESDAEEPDAGSDAGVTSDAGVSTKPVVHGLSAVTQISAAGNTTCARTEFGAVFCWGANDHGELGRLLDPPGDSDPHPGAAPVAIDGAMERVDVGNGSVCAKAASGEITCWGNDQSAQLARGGPTDWAAAPARAEIGSSIKRTGAGIDTGFALTEDGHLLSWGALAGTTGILSGRKTSVPMSSTPYAVDGLTSISNFAISGPAASALPPNWSEWNPLPPPNQHACALSQGEIYCWGKSDRGAFGIGLPDTVLWLPTHAPIASKAYPQQLAVGGKNTCARFTDGSIMCTGDNARGQLGAGRTDVFSTLFVGVTSFTENAVHVSIASDTVCALLQGGAVECWGGNTSGELGTGASDEEPHPSTNRVTF